MRNRCKARNLTYAIQTRGTVGTERQCGGVKHIARLNGPEVCSWFGHGSAILTAIALMWQLYISACSLDLDILQGHEGTLLAH